MAAVDPRHVEREAAVTHIFHCHHSHLVRLAVVIGADDEAEDIVAEAFFQLHRRWDTLRDPSAALPYLRSIIYNLARMRLRHLQIERRHLDASPADVDSAESAAMLREDQREVVAALRRLPARQREAVVLRYWLGLREAEVACAMGISRGAVKAHTSRAMGAMKRALAARG